MFVRLRHVPRIRDVGSISNLEGQETSRELFLKKKGALSKNKKGTSSFIVKSWGARAPSAFPVPTSMPRIGILHETFFAEHCRFFGAMVFIRFLNSIEK